MKPRQMRLVLSGCFNCESEEAGMRWTELLQELSLRQNHYRGPAQAAKTLSAHHTAG